MVKDALSKMAAEPSPGSPQALAELVKRDAAKYRQIVTFSGATVD